MAKIVSCVPAGKHQTYDLEVNHPNHQFYLANGALTSNSHAMAYAITSYQCVHGQTRIFDWETRKYTTVAKAYREGGVNKIACYDEKTGKTIGGQVKKIIRTTGAKSVNLKMAYVLYTSSGKKLVCSKDHPILTDANGYQTLENLKVGDKIACEKHVLSRYGAVLDENRKNWCRAQGYQSYQSGKQ
jgi:hypothetical protein